MALLLLPPPPSPSFLSASTPDALRRDSTAIGFAAFSSHSSPRILKSNRPSRHDRRTPPYDDEEEGEEEDGSDGVELIEDVPVDLEYCGGEHNARRHLTGPSKHLGNQKLKKKVQKRNQSKIGDEAKVADVFANLDNIPKKWNSQTSDILSKLDSVESDSKGKLNNENFSRFNFQKLQEELDFDEKWLPLLKYLSKFGLKESHFISIYERHMPCLQINLASAEERLEFLLTVGVKRKDLKRILLRQPQILEYTVDNLKSHVSFLLSIGVPNARIGQAIASTPSLFSYSVEQSLKPTIRYLIEEVGIKESDVGKVVQLSPQILVQRISSSWTSRFFFLSKELGAPKDSIVKMVTKHPQLLHYSIEDGILPRINFLRSIGMQNPDILKVLTSLTQVLSLSLEDNLRPKYLYLVNELRNEVHSLTKYPTYLSLSLEQRIRPRHQFLVSLKKAPKGPFPLGSLMPTDECFCQQWARTSLEKYLAFRQSLLLGDFAKKYERKTLASRLK